MVLSGMLSPYSNAYILKKMQHLAAEYNELNQQDKRFASIMIMALRPWRPTVFEQFRRAEDKGFEVSYSSNTKLTT